MMSYLDLEDSVCELGNVRNLLEIIFENVFDEESNEISSWAMKYNSVLSAALRSVDNEIERISEIFDTLHAEGKKKQKRAEEGMKSE